MHASLLLAVAVAALAPEPGARTPAPRAADAQAPAAESVAALVRRCVEAYGGKRAIARAATRREEGSVTSILHGPAPGRIVRAYARPGRLRVEVAFPGSEAEIRVVDGGRGWRDGEQVEGPRLAAMMLQAVRLDLPALLASWVAKVEDRGTRFEGGAALRLLSIAPAPGLAVEVLVDTATGRIVRSRGFTTNTAMPIEFVTSYSDFRRVDGVLVPFREENWANGSTTGTTVLEKVEFPRSLPPQTFRP